MDPATAIAVLEQACASVSATLAQHQTIQQALATVRRSLPTPDPADNGTQVDASPNPEPGQ